jgi:hypothetical protein
MKEREKISYAKEEVSRLKAKDQMGGENFLLG